MPSSPRKLSFKEEIQVYLRQLSDASSAEFVSGDASELLIFKNSHHLVAFAFAGKNPDASYDTGYDFFKTHYRRHQVEWDKRDIAYVFCIPADTKNLYELSSRIESDTYFCRKFVIPLTEPVADSLARLPFLPLVSPEGPSLRPPSAQTFLQQCGVGAPLARDIVVQHARSPIGIVDDCVAGLHGPRTKLTRARMNVEVQVDASTHPVH
jgi:exonuclease SbcC